MKKIYLGILLSLMTMLMAGLVSADVATNPTCTFDQTATTAGTSSTYIRGTAQNLSISIVNAGYNTSKNVTSANISVNTGTITGALNFNTTKGTNSSYLNTTVNTNALLDDTSYTFTMNMLNETGHSIGTCTRAYNPDNSVPVAALSTPASASKDVDGKGTFTYTCSNSSSAKILIDGNVATMAESSDSCTYVFKYFTNGVHSHYIIASDGLNTTTSSTSTIEIRKPGGGGSQGTTTPEQQATDKKNSLATFLLILVALTFFIKNKGKK